MGGSSRGTSVQKRGAMLCPRNSGLSAPSRGQPRSKPRKAHSQPRKVQTAIAAHQDAASRKNVNGTGFKKKASQKATSEDRTHRRMATHSCRRGPSAGCFLRCCPTPAWPEAGGAGRSRTWGLLRGPCALSPPACRRYPGTLQQGNEPSLSYNGKGGHWRVCL